MSTLSLEQLQSLTTDTLKKKLDENRVKISTVDKVLYGPLEELNKYTDKQIEYIVDARYALATESSDIRTELENRRKIA